MNGKSFCFKFFYQKILLTGILILGCLLPIEGLDLPTKSIEDDSSLRLTLRSSWFTEAPDRVLNMKPFMHTLPGGGQIQVRAEPAKDEFMVVLARERNGSYPGWAQGSWILTRRRDNGNASRIRVFLRSDPYTYIQFRPVASDRCMMDIVLYDAYVVRSLPVPYSIDLLFVIPLEEALTTIGSKFPRAYFDPDPGMYRDLRTFISLVRKRLPELAFQDDGAIDEQGQYVYINTLKTQEGSLGLNCSGFAKWVVDGLLRPFTGERLSIPPLKQAFGSRGSSFTEIYEPLRDPFFGLDWTRNLASTARKYLLTAPFGDLAEIEVQKRPFSWIILRTKEGTSIRSYPEFLLNAGFGFEGIQPLLYTLAIEEPGNIYLASINNEVGPSPRMRQHFHVAVLVPYFNEHGTFQIAVFESAAETSFNNFKNRYPGHFVNLVRISVDPLFDP
ncbi:MAG: hypothetical protein LBD29_08920 [Treponema sp.]|jgi:hypothetical protein|nr:hypothetical protein [Treponema sp.]